MTCCLVCDQQLKALVTDVGASRPPGQAGTTSATGKLLGCAHASVILQPTAQWLVAPLQFDSLHPRLRSLAVFVLRYSLFGTAGSMLLKDCPQASK